jgi:prolipoprotein diacylglyceryltransferase
MAPWSVSGGCDAPAPTSPANLALAAVLVWLGRRRAVRAPGLFALYVTGYSAFRIVEELLRVDPAHHIFGLRLNFFLAITLTALGGLWFWRTQRRRPQDRRGRAPTPRAAGRDGRRAGTRRDR